MHRSRGLPQRRGICSDGRPSLLLSLPPSRDGFPRCAAGGQPGRETRRTTNDGVTRRNTALACRRCGSSLRWTHRILRVRTGSCSRPVGRQYSSPLLLERIAIECLGSLLLNEATSAWIRLSVVRARIRVYRERTLARSIGGAVRIHASMHDRGRTRPHRWERLNACMRSQLHPGRVFHLPRRGRSGKRERFDGCTYKTLRLRQTWRLNTSKQ